MSEIVKILPYTFDIDNSLENTKLHTIFVMGDKKAHRFELTLTRGTDDVILDGCEVTGYFTNFSENITFQVDGAAENGKAVVTLSDPCYTLHGQFVLTIQIGKGGVYTTVFLGEGFMRTSKTETIIYDNYVIYDVSVLISKIEAMREATDAANSAAFRANEAADRANEAADRAESTGGVTDEQIANAVNTYLNENPVTPGATAEQAAQIEANKDAIEELKQSGTGAPGADGKDGQDGVSPTVTVETIEGGHRVSITDANGTKTFDVMDGADGKDGSGGDGGSTVEIDDTLTQSGKAADAKVVGDKIGELNGANEKQDERLTTLETASGIVTVEPTQNDVPIIFYGASLPQTKNATTMPISYVSKTLKYNGSAETKAQGTSSLSYAKKNQTTKFDRKFNFKGWGEQSKFCLKANWIDLTHARNIVTAQLWGDVVKSRANYADLPELLRTSPNQGAIDGFPALVYANGVYQGRYTINIPKDGWMANMDKTLDTHCILCGENYASGCFRAAANINGSDWSDELHDTVPDAIKTRWNEVISFVMNSTDDEFKSGLSDYFFVDSLIDYDLFALASCGLDSMGKNQLYMTYDGQKWIATMYDMDSTWGLYYNGSKFVASDYARTSYEDYAVSGREGNLLYIRLEQNFYEEIQARWAELRAGALSYANIMTRFERFIGIVPPHIVKEDYASTTGTGSFTGIPSQSTNHIQQIRAFALARQVWTDEYVAALTPAEEIPCTGITLDQTTLTFTAAGTQTLIATVTPSDTTDEVTWSSDDPSIASVSGGVVTAKANGSTTITATCGVYSATCAVNVSGFEESTDDTILYQLAAPMTFNGTSDYVDTGVKLLENDIDHTIVFDAVAGSKNKANSAIFHCMRESSPYPGYAFAVSDGGTMYKLGTFSNKQLNTTLPANNSEFKVVITHTAGSSVIILRAIYNGEIQTLTADPATFTSITQNLLIGCYQTTTGGLGRFWNGTINDFKIYNRVLTDDEIAAYLT